MDSEQLKKEIKEELAEELTAIYDILREEAELKFQGYVRYYQQTQKIPTRITFGVSTKRFKKILRTTFFGVEKQ